MNKSGKSDSGKGEGFPVLFCHFLESNEKTAIYIVVIFFVDVCDIVLKKQGGF